MLSVLYCVPLGPADLFAKPVPLPAPHPGKKMKKTIIQDKFTFGKLLQVDKNISEIC